MANFRALIHKTHALVRAYWIRLSRKWTRTAVEPPPEEDQAPPGTVVASGARVQGNISGEGDVEVLGHCEGNVLVDGVVIVGEAGKQQGDIQARCIVVSGTVEGRIQAHEELTLKCTARVTGDLRAKRVAISPGAYYEGNIRMRALNPRDTIELNDAQLPRKLKRAAR